MTREEFIATYAQASGKSLEWCAVNLVALPCRCSAEDCSGWAMVRNTPNEVLSHLQDYGGAPGLWSAYVDELARAKARGPKESGPW